MIRTSRGELLKIEKNIFHSSKEYYMYIWKKKYNIVFKTDTRNTLKNKIKHKINFIEKNYSQ